MPASAPPVRGSYTRPLTMKRVAAVRFQWQGWLIRRIELQGFNTSTIHDGSLRCGPAKAAHYGTSLQRFSTNTIPSGRNHASYGYVRMMVVDGIGRSATV